MKERVGQKIKLKSVEVILGVVGEDSAMEIEITKIHPFKNHPFHVVDDDRMKRLVDSIRENGILVPAIVRSIGNDEYEMISGHRRMHAAQKLGMERIPVIIREMTDDEAIVKMVDSNIQREELLPSEKAFAYRMKMEAMRRQGKRSDLTLDQNGPKLTAREIGGDGGISGTQVKRYIRLTELTPELLDYVDKKRIQFTVAVEISYIDKEIQQWVYEYIKENGPVKINQVKELRAATQNGAMTQDKVITILSGNQAGNRVGDLTLSWKRVRQYFPEDYSRDDMRQVIEDLLKSWVQAGGRR